MGRRTGRLAEHHRQGWKTIKTFDVQCYVDAYRTEQAILRRLWAERQIIPCLTAEEMPQGGWTETVDANEVAIAELLNLIQEELQNIIEEPNYRRELV